MLAEVARGRQVLCVTHLPQVAAFADHHLRVEKRVCGGRTTSSVTPLADPGTRREEVARMLAGAQVTASALDHAAALIEGARGAGRARGAAAAASTESEPVSRPRRAGEARRVSVRSAARRARAVR
jgi:DNA repair protein RecN (Recombination protein N)